MIKILVVEDNYGIAELIQERLVTDGYDVSAVHSGKDALKILGECVFDLVILDYSLPDMDGKEIVTRVKENIGNFPPYIVSTGRGDEQLAVDFMKMGAYDYLVKDQNLIAKLPDIISKLLYFTKREKALQRAEKRLAKAVFETEETERKILAEQLHENIGPLISTIKMYMGRIKRLEGFDSDQKQMVQYCDNLVDDAVNRIRDMANDLMPNVLYDFGLNRALLSVIKIIQQENNILIHLQVIPDNLQLSKLANIIIYRGIVSLIKGTVNFTDASKIKINIRLLSHRVKIDFMANSTVNLKNNHEYSHEFDILQKKIKDRIESLEGSYSFSQKEKNGVRVAIDLPENI